MRGTPYCFFFIINVSPNTKCLPVWRRSPFWASVWCRKALSEHTCLSPFLFCNSTCCTRSGPAGENRQAWREPAVVQWRAPKVPSFCRRRRWPSRRRRGRASLTRRSCASYGPASKRLCRFSFCQVPKNWWVFRLIFPRLSFLLKTASRTDCWSLTLLPIVVGTEYVLGGGVSDLTVNAVRLPKPNE